MQSINSFESAREVGSLAAARELVRLGIAQDKPIDIFKIIEDAGLWLLFHPLDNLLGVYLGKGIMITTNRPRSVQRITAAHEYGHYVLKHEVSLDHPQDIEKLPGIGGQYRTRQTGSQKWSKNRTRQLEEAAAQAFALDFLMPAQLINKLWIDLGLPQDAQQIEARQIYQLSLFLGASYTATIYQLVASNRLPHYKAEEFLPYSPKKIKRIIGGGDGPEDSRADVWPLQIADSGRVIHVRAGDELHISLPESPSTGYVWTVEGDGVVDLRDSNNAHQTGGGAYLELAADAFENQGQAAQGTVIANRGLRSSQRRLLEPSEQEPEMVIGGGGTHIFLFRTLQPGSHHLRLVKRRPWQHTAPPAEIFQLQLEIAAKPTGDTEKGLSLWKKPDMAFSLAA